MNTANGLTYCFCCSLFPSVTPFLLSLLFASWSSLTVCLYRSVCLTFLHFRFPYLLTKCLPYKTVIVIFSPPSSPLSLRALCLLLSRLSLRETRAKKTERTQGGWGVEMVKKKSAWKRSRGKGSGKGRKRDGERWGMDGWRRKRRENLPQRISSTLSHYFTSLGLQYFSIIY